MNEVHFIKKNKARWDSYQIATANSDELSERFINLVDDLGYAKTHYPLSNTVQYLNELASNIYLSIYTTKPTQEKWFLKLVKQDIPLAIYKHKNVLLLSVILFTVFYLVGLFIATKDTTFVRAILSDEYVIMTKENVAKGKPFGVYDSMNEFVMFFYIAWNNIRVAFMTFVSGIFLMLGSIFFLFQNGIMVGAFHYMFIEFGYGWNWVLIVMIHGTLELFSIAIAGGCGLVLGNSFLFPKTYKRIESLRMATKDALLIMGAVLFMLVLAAIFESFVTRYEMMPVWLSIIILFASSAFIVYYFIFLPKIANRQKLKEQKDISAQILQYLKNV